MKLDPESLADRRLMMADPKQRDGRNHPPLACSRHRAPNPEIKDSIRAILPPFPKRVTAPIAPVIPNVVSESTFTPI
jgi:hypothetical protein